MNNRITRYFMFGCVCLLFLNNSCKEDKFNGYDNRLHIHNRASEAIYFGPAYSYPDTTLYGRGVIPTASPATYKVPSGGLEKLSINCCWENLISKLPADTLIIFIYDADTLEQISWEEVEKDYKILKRYDLSLQDLEHLDWNIYYPPTAEMKGIKMYP